LELCVAIMFYKASLFTQVTDVVSMHTEEYDIT
jgi:hypothetical protein